MVVVVVVVGGGWWLKVVAAVFVVVGGGVCVCCSIRINPLRTNSGRRQTSSVQMYCPMKKKKLLT